jgi:hypothetical protein
MHRFMESDTPVALRRLYNEKNRRSNEGGRYWWMIVVVG